MQDKEGGRCLKMSFAVCCADCIPGKRDCPQATKFQYCCTTGPPEIRRILFDTTTSQLHRICELQTNLLNLPYLRCSIGAVLTILQSPRCMSRDRVSGVIYFRRPAVELPVVTIRACPIRSKKICGGNETSQKF